MPTSYFKKYRPFILAVLIALFSGVVPTFAKIGLEVFGSFTLVLLRFFFAALVFIPFLRLDENDKAVVRKDWKQLAVIGIVSALNPILLFIALKFTQASVSPFIYAVVPALTALYLYFIQGESVSKKRWLGIGMGVIGVGLIVLLPLFQNTAQMNIWGNLLIFSAAIAFTTYGLLSRSFQKKTNISSQLLAFVFIITTLVCAIPFAIAELHGSFNQVLSLVATRHIIAALIIGILGTTAMYVMYQKLLEYDDEISASLFTFLQPVVTPVSAMILLGETVGWMFVVGGVLAIGGAYVAGRK